jgi:hypothetical protein
MTLLRELPEVEAVQCSGENELLRLRAHRGADEFHVEILPFATRDVVGLDVFRYKNRPHLRHRRFYAAYGLDPKGYDAFETEDRLARHVNAIRGPRLAWIPDAVVFLDTHKAYPSNALLPPNKDGAVDARQAR